MPKVDPETGNMIDDSPDKSDDSERGGKLPGDPALSDASSTGTSTAFSSEKSGGDETHGGVLPGEKPVRG